MEGDSGYRDRFDPRGDSSSDLVLASASADMSADLAGAWLPLLLIIVILCALTAYVVYRIWQDLS